VSTLNVFDQYKDVILQYRATQPPTSLRIILQRLATDYNLTAKYYPD